MDLRVLRYLVATVDAGSANRAATMLHVTQPVLSRQLRQLERTLGLRLFERRGTRLVLSREGEELLPLARDLLVRAERFEHAAGDLSAGRLERLRLAVPTTTLNDVLAPFLATLTAEDPVPVVTELQDLSAETPLAGVDLVVAPRVPPGGLASLPLAVLPVWAYVPGDHPWAREGSVDIDALAAEPVVLLSSRHRPRLLIDAAMEEAGLAYASVLECGDARVAQALAAAGRGVAVVTDDPRFDLVPLRIRGRSGDIRIRLYAAWDAGHHAAPTLAALAHRLSDFCAERYGEGVRPLPA